MKKQIKSIELTYWLILKYLLYFIIMMIFVQVMSIDNIGLSRLSRTLGVTLFTFVVVGALFLNVYGGFDIGMRKSKPIVRSLILAAACTDIISYFQVMIMRTNGTSASQFRLFNVGLLIVTFLLQFIVIYIAVYGSHWIYFKIHKPAKCLIITSSQNSLDVLTKGLLRFKKQYKVVKVIDYHTPNLKDYIQEVDTVFVYDVPNKRQMRIMRRCYQYKVNVYFNPDLEDVMEFNSQKYLLDDIYLYNKNVKAMTMEQRILKRLMDISLSIIGGIISSPIWIAAIIAIKLDDGGSVIFKQERATLNGKTFMLYKLRTMEEGATIQSAKKVDRRVTRPGRILRKTRIDEIPQLINVLRGEMSIVGPRPEMIKNMQAYTKQIPEFEYRLRMKAGLTGYAQIEGKYNTLPKDKLIMDMMYMEQFSIWRDIQLIFQTVIVLLKFDSTEGFDDVAKYRKYEFHPYQKDDQD